MAAHSETSSSTSSSLLRRAKNNDPQAWQQLCEIYAPQVYRWARQLGVERDRVADIGQEVFQVVAQRLGSFHKDRPGGSFNGWLWGITRNKVREYHRRKTIGDGEGGTAALVRLKELTAQWSRDLSGSEPIGDNTGLIHRVVNQVRSEFEPSTWQAFWRSAVEEEKTSEIADDLGMTTAAVRQAKYRVLRRLRSDLAELL